MHQKRRSKNKGNFVKIEIPVVLDTDVEEPEDIYKRLSICLDLLGSNKENSKEDEISPGLTYDDIVEVLVDAKAFLSLAFNIGNE